MAKKDTQKTEPVESLEDDISSAIDAAEKIEDEVETNQEAVQSEEEAETDNSADEQAAESETDTEPGSETDSTDSDDADEELSGDDEGDTKLETEDNLGDSAGEESDKLEAPIHWAANDREIFNNQPPEAQEWLLERHKSMEGDYTKKSQEIAATQRQYDAIKDALTPYEHEFASAGLDHAGAVRKLAAVHQALKTDGRSAILNLAQTYGINLDEEGQEYTDPALRQTQSQLSAIEQRIARQEQAAQQTQQEALVSTIKTFEEATDGNGKLLHPHFQVLQDDITALFNAGLAKDLGEGYSKAMSMRPDLAAPKPQPKANRAEKVAKAKKAATGIKSSGAVGKTPAKAMSLEDEIASQIP